MSVDSPKHLPAAATALTTRAPFSHHDRARRGNPRPRRDPDGVRPAAAAPAPAPAPAGGVAPGGFTGGGALKVLVRSHFVPAYDTWLDKWAADWGAKNKVEVQVDHILSADLAAKMAAEVAARAGHDIYGFTRNGEPTLYARQMVDVSDITKQISEAHGGWIPLAETLGLVAGVWHAVPEYFIDFPAL